MSDNTLYVLALSTEEAELVVKTLEEWLDVKFTKREFDVFSHILTKGHAYRFFRLDSGLPLVWVRPSLEAFVYTESDKVINHKLSQELTKKLQLALKQPV